MEALIIMVLVLVEVALWQWRVHITGRGNVLGGALLGLVGAVIQVTVISSVVRDMGDTTKVLGYACGVGIGVAAGCLVDRWLTEGAVLVRVIAPSDPTLVPALRERGWPLTATDGYGHGGPVDVLFVVVDRRHQRALEDDVELLAPRACWTVERVTAGRGLEPRRVDTLSAL